MTLEYNQCGISDKIDPSSIKVYGLNPYQIIFLAQYYESITGKDPRKIMFPEIAK